MSNQLAFALDIADKESAVELLDMIDPYIGAVKVGLEYFIANGSLPKTQKPIILDLKLHDIPETVWRAIMSAGELGVKYLTLHCQQQATMHKARNIADFYKIQLLGVSVLSSMDYRDLLEIDGESTEFVDPSDPKLFERMYKRISVMNAFGIHGFVCSPQDIKCLKQSFPYKFFLVPGVRPVGSDNADQKRVGTPTQAIKDGASMLVVGRPIRDAKNPTEAAKLISEEIETANVEMRRERDKL